MYMFNQDADQLSGGYDIHWISGVVICRLGYKKYELLGKQPPFFISHHLIMMEVDIMPFLRQARRGEIHPNRNAMPGKCTSVHAEQTLLAAHCSLSGLRTRLLRRGRPHSRSRGQQDPTN